MRHPPLQSPPVWAAYPLFWICGVFCAFNPLPAITGAGLIFWADKQLREIPRFAICAILFICAFGISRWRIADFENAIRYAPDWAGISTAAKSIRLSAVVSAVQTLPDGRLRVILANLRPSASHDQRKTGIPPKDEVLQGLCAWTWSQPLSTPLPGQKVDISRPVRPARPFANSPERIYNTSYIAKNIFWSMASRGDSGHPIFSGEGDFLARMRERLRQNFIRALEESSSENAKGENNGPRAMPQAKAILLALVFGDRSSLSRDTMENFSEATIAHSLALSGQHLCIAGFFAFLLVASLARARPAIYLSRPKIILIALASLPFAIAYFWIGNGPISLLRAFCMLLLLAWWLWLGSVFSILDIISGALCIILFFHPLAILDSGLQLSVLCIAIIAISLPALGKLPIFMTNNEKSQSKKPLIRALQILLISLLIQIALLPVSLAKFQIAGFWFSLNALWLPVLGIFVLPLAIFGLMLCALQPFFGLAPASLALNLAAMPCQLLLKCLTHLRETGLLAEPAFMLPHWSVLYAFAIMSCSAAWLFGGPLTAARKRQCARILIVSLLFFAIGPCLRFYDALRGNIIISALDVGQGQAIYVKIPGGINLLLDGGGSHSSFFDIGKIVVAPSLSANRPPYLSAVLNSHPDIDHLGGLLTVLEKFSVANLFHNGHEANGDSAKRWENIKRTLNACVLYAGDRIILGNPENGLRLEVLHPPKPDASETDEKWRGNAASLVLRFCRHEQGIALFPGDAEKSTINQIMEAETNLRSQILFMPHHGSDRSYARKFYEAVAPRIAVANCGFMNRWHYPGGKIKKYFAAKKIPLLETGKNGKIELIFSDNHQLRIKALSQ